MQGWGYTLDLEEILLLLPTYRRVGREKSPPMKSIMFEKLSLGGFCQLLALLRVETRGGGFFCLRKHTGCLLDFPEPDLSAKGETKRSM